MNFKLDIRTSPSDKTFNNIILHNTLHMVIPFPIDIMWYGMRNAKRIKDNVHCTRWVDVYDVPYGMVQYVFISIATKECYCNEILIAGHKLSSRTSQVCVRFINQINVLIYWPS